MGLAMRWDSTGKSADKLGMRRSKAEKTPITPETISPLSDKLSLRWPAMAVAFAAVSAAALPQEKPS